MNPPRPATKCRRCGHAYAAHVFTTRHCPDGSARAFLRHTESRTVLRFDRGELSTLETVLRNALHAGGSAHELIALLGRVRSALAQRAPKADSEPEAKAS